jgi:8-oxo-dGTP pyrophosphatase MutT (NUDIX family)
VLYLIPPALHRGALRAGHRLRLVWWRLRRPSLSGCRVLAFDPAGRILLVRHSYGSGAWMLPGGGLRRGEDPVAAAARECLEETGCTLLAPRLALVIDEALAGAVNRVHLVAGEITGSPRADRREIEEAALFAPDALPRPLSGQLGRELDAWIAASR